MVIEARTNTSDPYQELRVKEEASSAQLKADIDRFNSVTSTLNDARDGIEIGHAELMKLELIEGRRLRVELTLEELGAKGLDICSSGHRMSLRERIMAGIEKNTLRDIGIFPQDALETVIEEIPDSFGGDPILLVDKLCPPHFEFRNKTLKDKIDPSSVENLEESLNAGRLKILNGPQGSDIMDALGIPAFRLKSESAQLRSISGSEGITYSRPIQQIKVSGI